MASLKERASDRVAEVRERRPLVEHVVAMVKHYGEVNGNQQAGAVTFFGFLSFFPILALGFFVVGWVANVVPDVEVALTKTVDQLFPHMIGDDDGEIRLETFRANAGIAGLIGLVGVLYSGLGWLSGLRQALEAMFRMPQREQPGFVAGKTRDLMVLVVIGVTLLTSVTLSGATRWFSEVILGWLGLEGSLLATAVLWVVTHALGVASATLLLLAMFHLLARPQLPKRALLHGALLGAVGFELLKGLAGVLIGLTKDQPAFQAFGVALILLVWINYFSRLVMYGAAWAYTSPLHERLSDVVVDAGEAMAEPEPLVVVPPAPARTLDDQEREEESTRVRALAAVGAVAGIVAAAAVARRSVRPEG
ncbi:MAG TPA: YihY/virulence factor BrkB family protein [Nocardioidaceae bacterium]|nr:YihY/virulence factor BrkB family protein [Nocardioidaceae bacterium]